MVDLLTYILNKIIIAKGNKEIKYLSELSLNPMEKNKQLLMDILKQNADTEYGRKHDFASIKTIEDYKARVPFSTYDTYAEYIDRMKKGEQGFITTAPPVAMAATSGSVANPKAIPVSSDTINIYKTYGLSFGFATLRKDLKGKFKYTKFLNLMEVKTTRLPGGLRYGAISGFAVDSVKKLMPHLSTSPLEVTFPQHIMDRMYVHVRFSLVYRDLSGIVAAFMTMAVDYLNYIILHWELLTEDIETGRISPEIDIPNDVRESLMKKIKPNPTRAAELRAEFRKGFDSMTFRRIWPKLSYIYSIGSGGFTPYTEKIKIMTGNLPIYHSFFAASEGMMATCTEINNDRYTLLPQSIFFEFIPADRVGDRNPHTLTLDEVEVGEYYELVLTNLSGFYRYRINDVVKIMGMNNNCPQIQFAYRLNQMVSMAGEKTNDEHFRWAVMEIEKETGCGISEYSVFPNADSLPGRYIVLLEARTEEELRKLIVQKDRVRDILEEKLGEANPSLGSKIAEGLLGRIEVKFVQTSTYALYRDVMEMRGISKNQIKPIRIIDNQEKERFFFSLLEREE